MTGLFSQRSPGALRYLLLVLLSTVLMVLDHRGALLEQAGSGLRALVYPLHHLVDWPLSVAAEVVESVSSRDDLLSDNRQLRQEVLRLRSDLQRMRSVQAENRRLNELLQGRENLPRAWDFQLARVLKVALDPYFAQVEIGLGTRHGVAAGQPLLGAEGVFGQVRVAGPFSSRAILITDPSHAVPVRSTRTGLRSIAAGNGPRMELELLFLPNNVDVSVGDLMVTSGLGGVFPADYPVAVVSEVTHRPDDEFARVRATPVERLEQTHEVLIGTLRPSEPQV